jgi:hypothetical protein
VKETGVPSTTEASAGCIRGVFPPCLGWLLSEANGRLPTCPVGLSNESPNLLPFSFLVHPFSFLLSVFQKLIINFKLLNVLTF